MQKVVGSSPIIRFAASEFPTLLPGRVLFSRLLGYLQITLTQSATPLPPARFPPPSITPGSA